MNNAAMSKIYIQPVIIETFSEFLNYAIDQHCNLEIATFTYYNILEADWHGLLQQQKAQLSVFKGKVSMHGVFQDLLVSSKDNRIAEVSKNRVYESMEMAKELNASQIVFHGSFNPLIRDGHYKREWIIRNESFWSEILDKYKIKILLENTWEPTPDLFRLLLDRLNSPRFRVCFDVGHAHIYSKTSIQEWFASLGEDISYIHISDNSGEKHQHLEIGKGKIDWQNFSRLVVEYTANPELVLELVTLEKTKESLRNLEKSKIYPFNNIS